MVATISKDGSPHVTPVWVDTDRKNILVNTAVGRKKERNVTADPRVAIAVFDSDDPYSWVSINGKVVKKITGREADEHIDKMSYKYTGNKKYQDHRPGEKRVVLVVEPSHVMGWY